MHVCSSCCQMNVMRTFQDSLLKGKAGSAAELLYLELSIIYSSNLAIASIPLKTHRMPCKIEYKAPLVRSSKTFNIKRHINPLKVAHQEGNFWCQVAFSDAQNESGQPKKPNISVFLYWRKNLTEINFQKLWRENLKASFLVTVEIKIAVSLQVRHQYRFFDFLFSAAATAILCPFPPPIRIKSLKH